MGGSGNCNLDEIRVSHANHIFGIIVFNGLALMILCQCIGYILSQDICSVARNNSISGLGGHIAVSGCRSSSQSFLGALSLNSSIVMVENSRCTQKFLI